MEGEVNNVAFIVVAWGAFAVLITGYVVSLLVRGRKLSAKVPPARRRWATTPDPGAAGTP